jgi:hypothetical protein
MMPHPGMADKASFDLLKQQVDEMRNDHSEKYDAVLQNVQKLEERINGLNALPIVGGSFL